MFLILKERKVNLNIETENDHGGRRPGAGRKPNFLGSLEEIVTRLEKMSEHPDCPPDLSARMALALEALAPKEAEQQQPA